VPILPGPDRPGQSPADKRGRTSTTGNRYTSSPPPSSARTSKRNPRIVGRYKVKPTKVPKGLIVKKRGGGKGYVTVRRPGAAPRAPGAPGSPGAPGAAPGPNTYPEYADFPSAQGILTGIDRDEASHLAQAQKVGDWLKGALTGLTGVDPSQPGLNPALQQQYLANVQGVVGGAMGAAAEGAAGPQVAPTTPGAIAVSPTAYLSQAAREGNVGRSSAMLQAAQSQAALNTLQPNTQSQAYIRAYADMQAGLPAVYATRRSEARMKIDEFILGAQQEADKLAEDARHNRVSEATSAWNAQTNAAIAAGRLGLDSSKFGAGQADDSAESSAPVPDGFVRLPDGSFRNEPTPPDGGGGGGTSTKDAQGRWRVSTLQDKGYNKFGPKPPARYDKKKFQITRGADGNIWIKRKSGTGGTTTTKKKKGADPFDVQKDLTYSLDNGFIDGTDAGKSIPQLVRFLRKNQPSSLSDFPSWWAEIGNVLKQQDPNLYIWMRDYVTRRRNDKSWKGRF